MEQHRVQRWALEWGMRSMVYWTTSSNPQREGTTSGVEKMAQFLKDDSCSVKNLLPYKTCCIKLRSNFICISHESDEVVRLQRTYNSCHFCMLRSEIYLRADCWYIADISELDSEFIQECDFMQLGIECLILMRQVDLDTKHYMASEFRLGVFVITVTIMPAAARSESTWKKHKTQRCYLWFRHQLHPCLFFHATYCFRVFHATYRYFHSTYRRVGLGH